MKSVVWSRTKFNLITTLFRICDCVFRTRKNRHWKSIKFQCLWGVTSYCIAADRNTWKSVFHGTYGNLLQFMRKAENEFKSQRSGSLQALQLLSVAMERSSTETQNLSACWSNTVLYANFEKTQVSRNCCQFWIKKPHSRALKSCSSH